MAKFLGFLMIIITLCVIGGQFIGAHMAALPPPPADTSDAARAAADAKWAAVQAAHARARATDNVEITKVRWGTVGFGTVGEFTFTIENKNAFAVKDITVTCKHSGPSGTRIDSNTRTIYQRIAAKSVKTIPKFSMGFVHSQATSSSCSVTHVVAEG